MGKKAWLLLVVAAVLLAAVVLRMASRPSAVSGGEVPRPAAAAPAAAPKPQPAKVPSAPAVETSEPQPVMPEAAAEIAAEIAAQIAPEVQEQQPSGDGAPQVDAIIAGTGNQFRALVGDTLVSEGSMVQGFRVRKVQADGVEFERDGQIWVQKLD